MGNCLTNNNCVVSRDVVNEQFSSGSPSASSKVEPSRRLEGGKSKMVRFMLCELESNNCGEKNNNHRPKGDGVRIKVVLTREELKQFLRYEHDLKYSSLEHLISDLRLNKSKRRIYEVGSSEQGNSDDGNWKPTLESIPEDPLL